MLFELVFFVLKPDQHLLSSSTVQFHGHVRKRSLRGPKAHKIPSTKEDFISAISVSPTRHSYLSKLISRKPKDG